MTRSFIRTTTLAALLVAMVAPAAVAAKKEADESPIKKLQTDFAAAWNRHDAGSVAAFWMPDGDLITPDGVTQQGRDAVRAFFANGFKTFFADTKFSSTINATRFLTPDIAIVDCSFEVAGEKDPSGNVVTETGLYTSVYRRLGNKWYFVAVRPMHPVPAETPPATTTK